MFLCTMMGHYAVMSLKNNKFVYTKVELDLGSYKKAIEAPVLVSNPENNKIIT